MNDQIVSWVLDSIRNGRGAEVTLTTHRHKNVRIVFIPSPIYSDKPNELLIASEGHGVHFFDGLGSLTYGKLIGSGFPFEIAQEVAILVEHIMKQARSNFAITLPREHQQQQKRLKYEVMEE